MTTDHIEVFRTVADGVTAVTVARGGVVTDRYTVEPGEKDVDWARQHATVTARTVF